MNKTYNPISFFSLSVIKQRMQMCCSPHDSTLKCAKTIYTNEGGRAFYRSYTTALSMNIPYQMAMFVTYKKVQEKLNPQNDYKPSIHFLAGAIAGGAASFITMPLDVCKTLLNTQESAVLKATQKQEVRGFFNAFKTVWRMAGWRGLFNGLTPRVLYQVGTFSTEDLKEFCTAMLYLFVLLIYLCHTILRLDATPKKGA